MNKPDVLIIADKEDVKHLDIDKQSDHWNIFWEIIDYNRLHKSVDEIQIQIKEHNVDFIVYSRNDQVANRISIGPVTRKLRVGYSSFSGIDDENRTEQMQACFDDFMKCGRRLDFDFKGREKRISQGDSTRGTFSLLFDTEQLGGVRYGLPRLLQLLNRYDVKATFFVTNLVKRVYSDVLEVIQGQDHEVAFHGLWHEYFSGLNPQLQETQVRIMAEDFGPRAQGANLLGRMDGSTISALISNRLRYFVYPAINYYLLFSYSRQQAFPCLICLPEGDIWALPISVETYGSPWFSIRSTIDSAISRKGDSKHISVLCHPFRDGNLRHIETTEKLIRHLMVTKGLASITLGDLESGLDGDGRKVGGDVYLGEFLGARKMTLVPPRTGRDIIDLIPQNLIMIYRKIRRGHTLF